MLKITEVWTRGIEIPLKAPIKLSRGEIAFRKGFAVIVEGQMDGVNKAGLGEVMPLPEFHVENIAEAQTQTTNLIMFWKKNGMPEVPLELGRLKGDLALTNWLNQHCPESGNGLCPSVRAGFEMALLHLIRRVSPQAKRPSQSTVSITRLVIRDEVAPTEMNSLAAKIKVGNVDPLEDAKRANDWASKMKGQPKAKLRFDANRAWNVKQAAAFINGLEPHALQITEYLEEPLQPSEDLLKRWEELAKTTDYKVKLAVDESLTEGIITTDHLEGSEAFIGALILKPTLQGLDKTIQLANWAARKGHKAVLSSCFESGIALGHLAILASILADPWEEVSHGLGTFTRLSEDVLQPPFSDLVSAKGSKGWQVSTLSCKEASDSYADALVADRERSRR